MDKNEIRELLIETVVVTGLIFLAGLVTGAVITMLAMNAAL